MKWLTADWQTLLPNPWVAILLVLTSLLAGALVGTERQRKEKPAGLRTLILVSLGSAAFTIISHTFTSTTGDSGRVAAQIVTGIGFLGAGVIMHGRGTISGTTTAAVIWVVAAVGMVAGAGYPIASLGLALLVRGVLVGVAKYEVHLTGGQRSVTSIIEFEPDGGKTRVRINRILADYPNSSVHAEWTSVDKDLERLTLSLHLPQLHLHELLADVAALPEVFTIQQTPLLEHPSQR